jgi:hypothetical protein
LVWVRRLIFMRVVCGRLLDGCSGADWNGFSGFARNRGGFGGVTWRTTRGLSGESVVNCLE